MEASSESWNEESLDFYKDELYENFRAPKWVDFSSLDCTQYETSDDCEWFFSSTDHERHNLEKMHGELAKDIKNESSSVRELLASQNNEKKKKSTTCPKPFRFRTEERAVLREAQRVAHVHPSSQQLMICNSNEKKKKSAICLKPFTLRTEERAALREARRVALTH